MMFFTCRFLFVYFVLLRKLLKLLPWKESKIRLPFYQGGGWNPCVFISNQTLITQYSDKKLRRLLGKMLSFQLFFQLIWSFQVWVWNNRWHMCLKKAPQENAGKSLSDFSQELLILDRVLDRVSRKNGFLKIWHSAKTVVVRNGSVPFASNSISREHPSA